MEIRYERYGRSVTKPAEIGPIAMVQYKTENRASVYIIYKPACFHYKIHTYEWNVNEWFNEINYGGVFKIRYWISYEYVLFSKNAHNNVVLIGIIPLIN